MEFRVWGFRFAGQREEGTELHRGFENQRLPAGLLGLLFAKRVAERVLESRRVARRGCCTGGYCKRVLWGWGGDYEGCRRLLHDYMACYNGFDKGFYKGYFRGRTLGRSSSHYLAALSTEVLFLMPTPTPEIEGHTSLQAQGSNPLNRSRASPGPGHAGEQGAATGAAGKLPGIEG